MSYSRGSRYGSRSPYSRSSYSRYRSRSRSVDSSDAENPGNNLYVTGLSARVTDRDLEKHFSTEGEVIDASIVHDPWTRESRGFGFVTMATVKEADCCIKYLDRSVLEGRVISVEKAKRRRGRTPTPGKYLGTKSSRGRRYSPSYSPVRRDCYSSRYSPDRRDRYSSRYSPDRDLSYSPYGRGWSYSPYDRRRSYSPNGRHGSYSPYDRRRSHSPYYRSRYRSRSPYCYRRRRPPSVSPYYSRRWYRSVSKSPSVSPRARGRSYSRSLSPQRSYSRSHSPESERSTSYSPKKGSRREPSRSRYSGKRRHSRESYSHSRSLYSRSMSRERSA
ncbi:serine/arginine-rich splicing factor SR45a isoform X2 [Miscanthus floridulus]|uniref:serine/arginine-rich splicing factor SR45a isoform X2 n=1 Tax=Miscanthus floridulus TaxID=154761 RepID=UPI00345B2C8F